MTSLYPFKLGSKVFQLLLDIFLYHDFSVLNFIKGLQVGGMVIVPQMFLTVSCVLVCCLLVHTENRSDFTCNKQYYVNEWPGSQTNKCNFKLMCNN